MDNLRGSLLLVLSMACFTAEDAFIKLLSATMPTGQILLILGIGGTLIFWALMARKGHPLWTRDLRRPTVLARSTGEFVAALCFVTALSKIDISLATAILQAAPLATVMGAALFLREQVGWRRWAAIFVGFIGVLLVVKPGMAGFDPASLYALGGVGGLVLRDLSTRKIPAHVSSEQVSAGAYIAGGLAGALLLLATGDQVVTLSPRDWLNALGMLFIGAVGYFAIVTATRIGEVSVVIPFRYTRLVFAMIAGAVFFGERPDRLTLVGSAIIVASGLYTIWRERKQRRRAASQPA